MADQSRGHERVRHAKVKTGCITCRNRRVKCDETRPQCLRCRKYGTECSGYPAGRRRPPSSAYGSFAAQARALVPKHQTRNQQLLLQPTTMLFGTEQEHRYFKLFSERIANEICPYFNAESWSRMILQACTAESSIRHAAVAIGALGKAYEISQSGSSSNLSHKFAVEFDRLPAPGPKKSVGKPNGVGKGVGKGEAVGEERVMEAYTHHRRALEQYDKAIKRMRNDISSGNQSMRTTLIICIIITCFEAIHGNHESAAGQLQSGLALIQDWKSKQKESGRHPQGFSSPAPDVVEDFLVQTFGRMEIHSMSVFDPRPIEIHDMLKTEGKETIQQMPTLFNTLDQARVYLDLITRRLMHFNASIHDPRTCIPASTAVPPPSSSFPDHPIPWTDGNIPQPMPWIDGKIPLAKTTLTLSSSELSATQTALLNELAAWEAAFNPLLTFCRAAGGQDAISALTLTVSAVASQISLRAAFFINESAYDIFLPEFKLIVEHAAVLLYTQKAHNLTQSEIHKTKLDGESNGGPLIQFAFDIGIVPPLYLVIVKCRDRHIRRQALRLLEQYPRREGVWDSVATVALGRWVIRLEEEGAKSLSLSPRTMGYESPQSSNEKQRSPSLGTEVGDGDEAIEIPEEMRVRKAAMRFDLLERRADMNCLQMDVESGIFVAKKEVYTW